MVAAPPRFIHLAVVTTLALGAAAMASAVPANADAHCDTTVSTWSSLQAAMLTADEVVCLGASLSQNGDYLAIGATAKSLDLNGFDLAITGPAGRAAVQVNQSQSLTLQATGGGRLTATGGNESPGIGGSGLSSASRYGSSGTIVITSGEYILAGGSSAAALGGGWGGNAGPITINGGNVEARGGTYGAGIGGGDGGSGGTVTITSGAVYAYGGALGAGVGGGCERVVSRHVRAASVLRWRAARAVRHARNSTRPVHERSEPRRDASRPS